MPIIVQKYGGTSVANPQKIKDIAHKIRHFKTHAQVVVVLSAMSGQTNTLTSLGKEMLNIQEDDFFYEPELLREMDALLATGEMVTTALLAMHLNAIGIPAISLNAFQARIETDNHHGKSRIHRIDTQAIKQQLDAKKVVVVTGFQGIANNGDITTLGRGGSDTTAVALAASLDSEECQIYTDVDGVYTADPRIIKNAKKIPSLDFEEMLEMSSLGSKVLQIRSVEIGYQHQTNIRVLSSFLPIKESLAASTLIQKKDGTMEKASILSVVSNKDEAKIRVCGLPDEPNQAYQVTQLIADQHIEIDMIVQNISQDNFTDFTFTVHRRDFQKSMDTLKQHQHQLRFKEVQGDDKIVKVSLVGAGMKSHAGVASKMFKVLGQENINIQMISTSEIKISVVVHEKYHELAVRALHEAFIET